MHQTTVRFGPDLWEALEDECSRLGVSAAQFLREAALARLSYTAGRRGDAEYAEAYSQVDSGLVERAGAAVAEARSSTASGSVNAGAALADAAEQHETSSAVTAQNELARRRSRALRGQAAELRREGRLRLE
jgi:hypothetical protein